MKLVIRVLVLIHNFLVFSEGVNYDDPNIYIVKFVDNVYYERPYGQVMFEVDERQIDTDQISQETRMNMCRIAAKVVTKENIPVTVTGTKPGKKHSYTIRMGDSDTVQFVDAFKCPTKPAVYLQVIVDESGKENVIAMVQSKHKCALNASLENVQYKLQVVTSISEATEREITTYGDEDDAVDEDAFSDGERFQMCEDAMGAFPEKDVRYSRSRKIGRIKFYKLDFGGGKRNNDFEVVQAFRCPSSPLTFVAVPKKIDGILEAWLIVEERERPDKSTPAKDSSVSPKSPRATEIVYEYQLKPVRNIIDVTIGSPGEARITEVIRSAVDLGGLHEEKRQQMCRKALGNVERDYRFVRHFLDDGTEPSKYYALHSNIGDRTINIEIVEAFQCPTKPGIYIHVNELKRNEALVWVIIKDRKIDSTFQNAIFNVHPVKNIEKASTRDIVRQLSSSREKSELDSDDLTKEERHEICRRAIKNISGKEVKYLDTHTGMSKLYSVQMAGSEKKNTNDDSNSECELFRAFLCPTEPEVYLEVLLDWELGRFIVQILIKASDLEAQCDDSCYQIKLIDKIVERSKYKGNIVFDIPQTEVVNTDDIDENKRMEMCKKAVKINALKNTDFRFLPKTKAGSKKSYVLELKGANRRSTPELVEAFKCPTKPAVYLHVVKTEDEKEMVWVIFNDNEPDEVKFVGDEDDPRIAFCRKALEGESVEGSKKSKYYLFAMEIAGTAMDEVSGKDVLKKFMCPTKPSLKLEIHPNEEEDDDYRPIARPAWRPRELPGSKLREINYRKKYVDRITEASSGNKSKYVLDTEEFHEDERYKMCKDASRKVSRDQIEFMGNKSVGKTMTYKLHSETQRTEYVQAFQCPTIPPIFLEVLEDEDENIVWIILERDESALPPTKYQDDVHYEVKYITEIKEATSHEIETFEKRRNAPLTDEEEFTEEERFQMCKNAAKEVPGKRIKFMELLAGESTYYSIRREDSETHRESDTLEVVRAFECPTRPQIHLQIEDNGNTVSIIVKRVPPIRDGIRSYKLKVVRSIKDVDDQDKRAYEVRSLLAPEDLEYSDEMRRRMCVRAAKIIPNARTYLKWIEEEPGEEKFYAVEVQDRRSITREVLSAFECPTDPAFYLETFVDRFFCRSVWVILDEKEFYFSAE